MGQEKNYGTKVKSVAEKYVKVVQDMFKHREPVVRCAGIKMVQGGGEIISGICSEPFLVCSGDG